LVARLLKKVTSLVPTSVIDVMITRATNEAISAYSMAVTPRSVRMVRTPVRSHESNTFIYVPIYGGQTSYMTATTANPGNLLAPQSK
jgi:hypothetical protein